MAMLLRISGFVTTFGVFTLQGFHTTTKVDCWLTLHPLSDFRSASRFLFVSVLAWVCLLGCLSFEVSFLLAPSPSNVPFRFPDLTLSTCRFSQPLSGFSFVRSFWFVGLFRPTGTCRILKLQSFTCLPSSSPSLAVVCFFAVAVPIRFSFRV